MGKDAKSHLCVEALRYTETVVQKEGWGEN